MVAIQWCVVNLLNAVICDCCVLLVIPDCTIDRQVQCVSRRLFVTRSSFVSVICD